MRKFGLFHDGSETTGIVVSVKPCRWIKINTKMFRTHPTDGAMFPHIVRFSYTVDGQEYIGKKMLNYKLTAPSVGDEITVCYLDEEPKICIVKSWGLQDA